MARRGGRLVACALAATFGALAAPPVLAAGDPAETYQWALGVIGAKEAREAGTGEGTTIAVIDTGVDLQHEDLVEQLVPGANLVNPGAPPQDDNGRGTHVAGIAAAATGNGKGIAGVAPRAKIAPVKAFDSAGQATTARVVDGIRWAADHGIEVIDVSLEGDSSFSPTALGNAVQYAWDKGSIVVVASGQSALFAPSFADRPAIVVAATTRRDGQPSSYSSSAGDARWALSAPGGTRAGNEEDDILSTYWPHRQGGAIGETQEYGRYRYLAGTSMAAGHVAGAAAVLRGLGLSRDATVQRLLSTARDIGPPGRDSTFGSGLLDLARAVRGLRPQATSTTTSTLAPGSTTSTSGTGPAPAVSGPVGAARPPSTPPAGNPPRSAPVPTTASPPQATTTSSTLLASPGELAARRSAAPGLVLVAIAVVIVSSGVGGWWWRRTQLGGALEATEVPPEAEG